MKISIDRLRKLKEEVDALFPGLPQEKNNMLVDGGWNKEVKMYFSGRYLCFEMFGVEVTVTQRGTMRLDGIFRILILMSSLKNI